MAQVLRMHMAEAVGEGVDYAAIQDLKAVVGALPYEEFVEEMAVRLIDRVGQLDRAMREADFPMCYRHAVRIGQVAEHIGLVGVAKVVTDVMACCCRGDIEALSAVVGRLERLAEASLFSVFEGDF